MEPGWCGCWMDQMPEPREGVGLGAPPCVGRGGHLKAGPLAPLVLRKCQADRRADNVHLQERGRWTWRWSWGHGCGDTVDRPG